MLIQSLYFAGMKEPEAEGLWVQGFSRLCRKTSHKGEREKGAEHGGGQEGGLCFTDEAFRVQVAESDLLRAAQLAVDGGFFLWPLTVW